MLLLLCSFPLFQPPTGAPPASPWLCPSLRAWTSKWNRQPGAGVCIDPHTVTDCARGYCQGKAGNKTWQVPYPPWILQESQLNKSILNKSLPSFKHKNLLMQGCSQTPFLVIIHESIHYCQFMDWIQLAKNNYQSRSP